MKYKICNKGGFTLIEIIVSLALIGIIAVGIIPAFAAQLKMTINTKEITSKSFEAQSQIEEVIQTLKTALVDDTLTATPIAGVTSEDKTIFGRTVTMYKLVQSFPSNANKEFMVFMSKKLANMEVRQLLVAEDVKITVSGETIHTVADLKKTPKPTLTGLCKTNTDPNWYTNLFKWYVSKEGDPNPVYPDDFEKIVFSGTTPNTLTDLSKLANRYIVFTVTPVDIHGVRGNEAESMNRIYVLGQEWRAGSFAWVDKDEDVTYVSTSDVLLQKALTWTTSWPLVTGFISSSPFPDPTLPENDLDPSNGSLYVPMSIDRVGTDVVGPIVISGANLLNWVVDKSIHLATDITVSNNSDIYMKALDGDIVLYQYIKLNPVTKDAMFETDGMPSLIPFGPALTAPYGDIQFETGARGNVTLQNYAVLAAGNDIILSPFGDVNIYNSQLNAGGVLSLDGTKGSTYPGERNIIIKDSTVTLEPNTVANRSMTMKTWNAMTIYDTIFNGNTGAASTIGLTAPDGISLRNTIFNNSAIQFNSNTAMVGGGWNASSTLTIPNGTSLSLGASGTKVDNAGNLVLGDTGAVSFVSSMAGSVNNDLKITLGNKVGSTDEVTIQTNYGRNVGYAGESDTEYLAAYGEYQDLGSGNTNMEFTVAKSSGYGSPVLTYDFDGNNTIKINAGGVGPMSAYYTLSVGDQYAEEVVGNIVFRVRADDGESPVVTVIGSAIPKFTVTFDKNGGYMDANPSTVIVNDGEALGTLPEPPIWSGYNFIGWNTAADGSGSSFNTATIVTEDLTVYAQYSAIPVFVVTFDKNGGTTEANPVTMTVLQGSAIGTLPTPPTKTYYGFFKWSTTPTGGSEITASTKVYGDLTAYAQWTRKSFTSIANGEYVSIKGILFQKISDTRLLTRNSVGGTGNWNVINNRATSYRKDTFGGYPWITASNLLSGTDIAALNNSSIRSVSFHWWGGEYFDEMANVVDTNGTIYQYWKNSLNSNCRPYITINNTNLYVQSGLGTSSDPYVLVKE